MKSNMKNVICAGNALKETATASEVLDALKSGVDMVAGTQSSGFLVSDGGDGFLEVFARNQTLKRYDIPCTGPLSDSITAPVLFDEETETAFIEIALCSGLHMVPPERRNIMISGTAGVADLLGAAKELRAREVVLGLGGSATCDGGIGFLWKLAELAGQRRIGTCEPRVAMDMTELPSPDIPGIRAWLGDRRIIGCVDVDNPLTGPNGAARVFAPQKGADELQTEQLDAWIKDWCLRVQRNAGVELCGIKGTGAAGGLGFALAAIGGKLMPGAEYVCQKTGMAQAIAPGTYVLVTEGKFDATSFGGKAPWTVAQLALEHHAVPVIFCGIADENAAKQASEAGVSIVEFGRGLSLDRLREDSMPRLIQAVAGYLQDAGSAK